VVIGRIRWVAALFEKPETPALRFDSPQDVLDYCRQYTEDCSRWMVTNSFDLSKRYKENDIEIVVKVRVGAHREKYDLILSGIPSGFFRSGKEGINGLRLESSSFPQDAASHRSEPHVFVCITQIVKCAENVIPSFVRLERPKDRKNLLRNILGSSLNGVFKFSGGSSEGEGCSLWLGYPGSDGDCVTGLVKGGSQICESVSSNEFKGIRDRQAELEFVDSILTILRVRIDGPHARILLLEQPNAICEVSDVFFSPRELSS
jgi:hypothetical protein